MSSKFRVRLMKKPMHPHLRWGAFDVRGHYVWGSCSDTAAGCMCNLYLAGRSGTVRVDTTGKVH